jgi:O-6-methylguanine DNA methyltransferase
MPHVVFSEKPPSIIQWGRHITPIGSIFLGTASDGAICRLAFAHTAKPAAVLKEWQREWPKTKFRKDKQATEKTAQLLFGKKSNGLKIRLTGTKFQQKVWKALLAIPKGQTASYAVIAKRIKKPGAARAAGNAAGANPVPILVPCHRVIASDGTLGGYSGGLAIKKTLLKAEGIVPPNARKRTTPNRA